VEQHVCDEWFDGGDCAKNCLERPRNGRNF
jgi:hypothetical protein